MKSLRLLLLLCAVLGSLAIVAFVLSKQLLSSPTQRPNFLLVLTDDQSWIHNSYAGYPAVKTPNFDRIARDGIYFTNAYTSAPTCTAARSAILTGQHMWRLGPAAQLWGEFPSNLINYQKILQQHGYKIGYTDKGWGPGRAYGGNPAGENYSSQRYSNVHRAFSQVDHVANFRQFLRERSPNQPFSFWLTPTEPHRPYKTNVGVESGEIDMTKLQLPPFLPDAPEVRNDLADYLYEIQWFDRQIADIFQVLQDFQVLDNTLVIYTSDNGLPFPRAKSNNYEYGVHVPLAIRWANGIPRHQVVTDFISLTDLAPTFLDLAGIPIPKEMTGHSFRMQLLADESGRIDKQRDTAFTGFQRHIGNARLHGNGYPSRAIYTDKFIYIYNILPQRWPAGRPPGLLDIDDESPTKEVLLTETEKYQALWDLAAAKRPSEELYARDSDPYQLHNLADNPEFQQIKAQLLEKLKQEMIRTGDPWIQGKGNEFDQYIYYGGTPK